MVRLFLSSLCLLAVGCGFQGSPFLDGDRPIRIEDSPWPDAATFAQAQWNPRASGAEQRVRVALDERGRCAREPNLAGYAITVPLTVVRCPSFEPATQEEARWFLAHEVGHLLGGGHLPSAGNVMCGPHACPLAWTYTAADVVEICRYGRGGRCGATP